MFASRSLHEDGMSQEIEQLLDDPEFAIKIAIVGSPSTGKTCLVHRFSKTAFPENVSSSTETTVHPVNVEINDRQVKEELWDIVGIKSPKEEEKRKLQYLGVMTFVICFDLTIESTFEDAINYWIPECKRYFPDTPIIMCGTKMDLVDATDNSSQFWKGIQ
ncbi:hypothetical protein C9374_007088 [Naegleria lovaniensis]|uniref:Uncharacterized protein n=1 Tax=Naegleria lovaniensis TaxID=51637 RepID=A0AA88H6K4_NAELO|nr:uncharacterized protein C9374_007088 [Naegleria lovaniensis]KAG2393557.1 hypothetical protein C9374_007088 [Naegleria lovaniensis]